jgi:hypothetical protein
LEPHTLTAAPANSVEVPVPQVGRKITSVKYLKHFIAREEASTDEPFMFLLDNHESYISVPAIN